MDRDDVVREARRPAMMVWSLLFVVVLALGFALCQGCATTGTSSRPTARGAWGFVSTVIRGACGLFERAAPLVEEQLPPDPPDAGASGPPDPDGGAP